MDELREGEDEVCRCLSHQHLDAIPFMSVTGCLGGRSVPPELGFISQSTCMLVLYIVGRNREIYIPYSVLPQARSSEYCKERSCCSSKIIECLTSIEKTQSHHHGRQRKLAIFVSSSF